MSRTAEKHSWISRVGLAIIAAPLLYVVGFGPACWLEDRDLLPYRTVEVTYHPLMAWAYDLGVDSAVLRYGALLLDPLPDDDRLPCGFCGSSATSLIVDVIMERNKFEPDLSADPSSASSDAIESGALSPASESIEAPVGIPDLKGTTRK